MSNAQVRLLSLAVIGGCSLIGLGFGSRDGGICVLVGVVTLVFFILEYKKMKD